MKIFSNYIFSSLSSPRFFPRRVHGTACTTILSWRLRQLMQIPAIVFRWENGRVWLLRVGGFNSSSAKCHAKCEGKSFRIYWFALAGGWKKMVVLYFAKCNDWASFLITNGRDVTSSVDVILSDTDYCCCSPPVVVSQLVNFRGWQGDEG